MKKFSDSINESISNKDINKFISYLSKKKKVLFLTTSNRYEEHKEVPKSTQLAYDIKEELKDVDIKIIEIPKLNIYPCEGNVSAKDGNNCGVKDAILKNKQKNPSGHHRCWASVNNSDDELWKISKELLESEVVIFFISIRWGQTNSEYQKLIERLNWIENRHTTLGEKNIISDIEAGCVAIGQNWRGSEVVDVQKDVYKFYGFKVPSELSFNWQYTTDVKDESKESYLDAPKKFDKFFGKSL